MAKVIGHHFQCELKRIEFLCLKIKGYSDMKSAYFRTNLMDKCNGNKASHAPICIENPYQISFCFILIVVYALQSVLVIETVVKILKTLADIVLTHSLFYSMQQRHF